MPAPTPPPTPDPVPLPTPPPTPDPVPLPTPPPTPSPTPDPTNIPETPNPSSVLLTESPTPFPSESLTDTTTLSPTQSETFGDVEASIQVDKSSYTLGEEIVVTFINNPPRSTDWIALQDESDLDIGWTAVLWVWTCGTQECEEARSSGTVVFGPGGPYAEEFALLEPGTYIMHLLRGDSMINDVSYESFASTPPFTIE